MMNKYRISELFQSHQGEGRYTGQLSVWVRFFACNLQCNGFGQENPKDPSTYVLPYKDLDVSKFTRLDQLPVLEYGCDSSYSWAAKFKHLCPEYTAEEVVTRLQELMLPSHNIHDMKTGVTRHLVFTGGEPLLPKNQKGIVDIINTFRSKGRSFVNVTVETNGTQELTSEVFQEAHLRYNSGVGEFFFSVSPKLETVAGEPNDKAIKPDVVKQYQDASYPTANRDGGQLKFVIANRKECWDELEHVIRQFRHAGVIYPVWIQPVGATVTQQLSDDVSQIALEALARGYNISARVQAYLYKNAMSY
jgi:6-pyruvoyltetrahydropterin 2'-reductase